MRRLRRLLPRAGALLLLALLLPHNLPTAMAMLAILITARRVSISYSYARVRLEIIYIPLDLLDDVVCSSTQNRKLDETHVGRAR
jgi:phosphatidylglycerophosphate synthase